MKFWKMVAAVILAQTILAAIAAAARTYLDEQEKRSRERQVEQARGSLEEFLAKIQDARRDVEGASREINFDSPIFPPQSRSENVH